MSNFSSIILAAGHGTRMKSKLPKVLHQIGGKPMLTHIIEGLQELHSEKILVVVGYKADEVKNAIGNHVEYVMQEEQLGTGHAVLQTKQYLINKDGITLILTGDTPLLTKETIENLIKAHKENDCAATVLTTEIDNPTGYGRIVRSGTGEVLKIVEEKDATSKEKGIKEINSGIFCFDNQKLFKALSKVNNNNRQGEYYLTDVVEILRDQGEKINGFKTFDFYEIIGINDRVALARAEKILKNRILEKHMREGVTIVDPDRTYIEKEVQIQPDTIIHPNTYLKGKTNIASNSVIGPNVELTDVYVGEEVSITNAVVISSKINKKAIVGPFAYIRPGSQIGESVKIGDFVEVKNSTVGDRSKVPHLSYIGDATLGKDINIGCGTITVNYDGFEKHRTEVGDRAFVGCNTNLIAPVTVGDDAYIAAGSTITDNVPAYALSIARQRQTNKEDYVKKIREKNQSGSK